MKFSFLISLVLWLVMFVAVALLYYALSSLGVFTSLQHTLASVTSSQGSSGVNLSRWTSATRVLGYTMLLGAVNVVLITAISTVGAVIYNLVTHLGGGIEVTLKESD
jgi:Flp pilus assembly pilin Flp